MAKSERDISGEAERVISTILSGPTGAWHSTGVLFEGSKPPREKVLEDLRKHPGLRRWPNRDGQGNEFFTQASTPMTLRERFALARVYFERFYRRDDIEALGWV